MGVGITRDEYEIELAEQYMEGYFAALNDMTDSNLEWRNRMMIKYEKQMKRMTK